MPIVDTSTVTPYWDNYVSDGVATYYHRLGQMIPVGEPKILLRYVKYARLEVSQRTAEQLVSQLGIQDGDKVLVLGAGFGWTVEIMRQLLPNSTIVAIDSGQYINSVKDQDETAAINLMLDGALDRNQNTPIVLTAQQRSDWLNRFLLGPRDSVGVLDEDLAGGASRGRVKQALGLQGNAKAEWGISEQVLPWLTDQECLGLSSAGHDICTTLCHLVRAADPYLLSELEPDPWNWKWVNSLAPTTNLLASQPWYTTTSWKDLLPGDLIMGDNNWVPV